MPKNYQKIPMLLYIEVFIISGVGIEGFQGYWTSRYVIISRGWNRGVPMYSDDVSSFQGVGVEGFHCSVFISGGWNREVPLYLNLLISGGWNRGSYCIQRCPLNISSVIFIY